MLLPLFQKKVKQFPLNRRSLFCLSPVHPPSNFLTSVSCVLAANREVVPPFGSVVLPSNALFPLFGSGVPAYCRPSLMIRPRFFLTSPPAWVSTPLEAISGESDFGFCPHPQRHCPFPRFSSISTLSGPVLIGTPYRLDRPR